MSEISRIQQQLLNERKLTNELIKFVKHHSWPSPVVYEKRDDIIKKILELRSRKDD